MSAAMTLARFRFAPSPTGSPHAGSLHTALFNWALARSQGGDFILRIDDTDPARNTPQAIEEMLDALHWLGLEWDEGPDIGGPHAPFYQSQRRERHVAIADRLLESGAAYHGAGDSPPVRLRLPRSGQTVVHDALRGPITFANRHLQDPIIVRGDGNPLYHLASVVDDHDMEITHIVRGEDWIATAPIHVHLYHALGWEEPVWVHLPLIRSRAGEKLSKRDPESGYLVHDFREAGYLPQALFNYLLLLGWSPPELVQPAIFAAQE
jgi:glutamyl-tRNA synthetase